MRKALEANPMGEALHSAHSERSTCVWFTSCTMYGRFSCPEPPASWQPWH